MLILWRGILIALCCLAVVICYPYYGDNAMRIMFTWAGIAFVIITILTIVSKALLIGKWHFFNTILDIAIIILFLYILLNIFPQLDGKSPYSKLKKGVYPTSEDIDVGLANLGLRTRKETVGEFKQGLKEASNSIKEVTTLIQQEYNK